jgi:Domain of unknown function (DUF4267)
MTSIVPLSVAALIAAGIIGIGSFYLFSPQSISPSFGLKPPASDPDTRAWLRLKGIRDFASGLVILTLMLTTTPRTVGLALLAFAVIPLGDMSIILASGSSRSKAFSIHGATCAVMLVLGLFLTQVL